MPVSKITGAWSTWSGNSPTTSPLLFKDIENLLGHIVLRLIPADLEILFPILGPRPPVIIDVARIRGGQLRRFAVGVLDIAQALDEGVAAIGIVRCRPAGEAIAGAERSDEGLRIVKCCFMIQADKFAVGVLGRLEGFHSLQLVAGLKHGVSQRPALNIRRPGN